MSSDATDKMAEGPPLCCSNRLHGQQRGLAVHDCCCANNGGSAERAAALHQSMRV